MDGLPLASCRADWILTLGRITKKYFRTYFMKDVASRNGQDDKYWYATQERENQSSL